MEEKKGKCRQCARCCKYFCVEVDAPDSADEIDDYAWIIAHEGVSIHVEGDEWHLYMKSRCKYLGDDGCCGIYEKRPAICRGHTPGECEADAEHELDYDDADVIITDMEALYEFGRKYLEDKKLRKSEDKEEDDDDYGYPELKEDEEEEYEEDDDE